jgi:hypothetical protein
MRVFVPMSDDWMDDPQFALEALVPYRCGMRLPHAEREPTRAAPDALREDCGGLAVWGEPDNPTFSRAA